MNLKKLNAIATLVVVLTLMIPWAAFADGVVNNIDTTIDSALEARSVNVGQTTTVGFYINGTTGDGDASGCNATGNEPASGNVSIVPVSPAPVGGATASPTALTFVGCGHTTAVNVTFTGVTAGVYTVSITDMSGGKTNSKWDTTTSAFTLTVNPSATPTTTTVTCPASVTYDGSAQEPCTATVTDSGGFSQSLDVTYSNNVNAGTATASASFAGDASHLPSSGSTTFTINKAPSTVTVSCPAGVTFDGMAQEPCSAAATGAGNLNQPLTVVYADNVNAGTATAGATYAGDANHTGNTGSATFTIGKATSKVTVTCPASVEYNGFAQTPCSASATGVGGLNETLTVSYTDNVNAGTAMASASFAGDTNHTGSSNSATFTIAPAPSLVTVNCPEFVVYDGSAQNVCTAVATGVGGLNETLTVTYDDNVNAGIVIASASFPGDANHNAASNSTTFEIKKAPSQVAITCPPAVVYTGAAQAPCSAVATGAGGLNVSVAVVYADNVNAGTATVTATYGGDANHESSSNSTTFTIEKAPTTTTVTCSNVVFNGAAQKPCTAAVTGAGGLNQSLTVSYLNNTNAGMATASASYPGDANHTGSDATETFTIDKAPSTTTLTCPTNVTYTGAALEPCSANVTGAGGLNESVAVTYLNNTNAGTATAQAEFTGDDNHYGSYDTKDFTIEKAPSVTTVSCPASVTYNGDPQTPCSAAVTGAGGLNQSLTVSYANNTNAGTATASASYAGDANHYGSSDSKDFTINKANPVCTVTGYSVFYDGNPHTATGSCKGVKGETLAGLDLNGTTHTPVGTYNDTWTFTDVTGNYNNTGGSVTDSIGAWTLNGFYQPVDMTPKDAPTVWNTVKGGSTVPLKWEVFAGNTELTSTSYIQTPLVKQVTCNAGPEDTIEVTATGGTSLRYDTVAGQFVYNWQTPKLPGKCYTVTMTTQDGSSLMAYFKLK